jgi:hypothetical protein
VDGEQDQKTARNETRISEEMDRIG